MIQFISCKNSKEDLISKTKCQQNSYKVNQLYYNHTQEGSQQNSQQSSKQAAILIQNFYQKLKQFHKSINRLLHKACQAKNIRSITLQKCFN